MTWKTECVTFKNIKNVLFTNFPLSRTRWTFFNLFSGLSSVSLFGCWKNIANSLTLFTVFSFLCWRANEWGKKTEKTRKTWNVSEVEWMLWRVGGKEWKFSAICGNGEHPVELIQLWSFLVLSHSNLPHFSSLSVSIPCCWDWIDEKVKWKIKNKTKQMEMSNFFVNFTLD